MLSEFATHDEMTITVRLVVALAVGCVIGLERTFHGRPAGFRTHSLVCVSSALLMLATVYQSHWMTEVSADTIRTDPTRMAQGIMTGIGFLGAGVIYKEGLNVRGLTTAASIWITASIGILIGIGFYFPVLVGAIIVLIVLHMFRKFEDRLPTENYAHLTMTFDLSSSAREHDVRDILEKYGFSISDMSRRQTEDGKYFEYRMTIRNRDADAVDKLSQDLRRHDDITEFRIKPISA